MTDVLEKDDAPLRGRAMSPTAVLVGVEQAEGAEGPSFSKVSHISFTATDAEASAEFWRRVFGFAVLERGEGEGWRAIVLLHPRTSTLIELQQHAADPGERSDPARTGFDHLGLKVDEPGELDGWQAHFERLGVPHTPTVHGGDGSVLTCSDPDGIQLEVFCPNGRP